MSKYKQEKCLFCQGIGMIKKTEEDICLYCNKSTVISCCRCEYKSFMGQYKECNKCLGAGEIWIDQSTKKEVLVWCLTK